MKRIVAIVVVGFFGLLFLGVSGSQLRESDQASLLAGAVELARGEASLAGNESYNYDKQYASYWVVAGILRVAGAVGTESPVDEAVRVANRGAALLFVMGLLAAVSVQRDWNWTRVAVLFCVLASPVVAFTVPVMSPNLVSGAFLLFLYALLAGLDNSSPWGWWRGVAVFLCAFAGTAARQDAILLFPLVALLMPAGGSLVMLLRCRRVWTIAGGAVLAILLGRFLADSTTSLPAPFFVFPVFVVYLAGGLGAVLVVVLLFSGGQSARRSVQGILTGLALLIPLVFYGGLLYTPRHLFVVALAVLATVFLPRGREFWEEWEARRLARVVVVLAVLGALVPWLVGLRLSSPTGGRLVLAESTLYPTADGFWPMGAYGSFLARMARAEEEPLDHNQELWAAWREVDVRALPDGKAGIVSSGMASLARLALVWGGREEAAKLSEAGFLLLDDRTLTKRELSVDRKDHGGQGRATALLSEGHLAVVGRAKGRSVLLWSPDGAVAETDDWVSLRLALAEIYGGNDFRLGAAEVATWGDRKWQSHRICLAARTEDVLKRAMPGQEPSGSIAAMRSAYDDRPWYVLRTSWEDLQGAQTGGQWTGEGLWVSCGVLPEFMDIGGYGK